MGRRGSLAAVAALVVGCGVGDTLDKLEDTFRTASGGVDFSLVGTFRLVDPDNASPAMLQLLVLRVDGTFHAELVSSCETRPCQLTVIDGNYVQTREFPDPSRASGALLTAYTEGGLFRMKMKRAAVADSPQVGLYHDATVDLNGTDIPFFSMTHPLEMWCATVEDCTGQQAEPLCTYACAETQARCICDAP